MKVLRLSFPVFLSCFSLLLTSTASLTLSEEAKHFSSTSQAVQIDPAFFSDLDSEALVNLDGFLRNQGNCLTHEEKKKLVFSIKVVEDLLNAAASTLRSYAELSDDNDTKDKLARAAEVVQKVESDVFERLTGIADEACGSCLDIARMIKDAADILFNALTDIKPLLKESAAYDSIVTATNAAIIIAEDICKATMKPLWKLPATEGSFVQVLEPCPHMPWWVQVSTDNIALTTSSLKATCLGSEQQDDIEEVIQLAGNVLNTFSQWLRQSKKNVKSDQLKYVLDKLADLLVTERKELEEHGEQVLETLCESCSHLAGFTFKIVHSLERIMDFALPFWKDIPPLKQVADKINALLSQAKDVCPYEYQSYRLYTLEISDKLSDQSLDATVAVLHGLQNFIDETSLYITRLDAPKAVIELLQDELLSLRSMVLFTESQVFLTCSDVLQGVEDVLDRLESALDGYLPQWRDLPLVSKLDNFVHNILHQLGSYCPNTSYSLVRFTKKYEKDSCFTDEFYADEKRLVKTVDTAIEYAEEAIELVKDNVFKAGPINMALQRVVFVLDAFKQEVNTGIFRVSRATCHICAKLDSDLSQAVDNLKALLDQVFPSWKEFQPVANVFRMVDSFLHSLREMCNPQSLISKKSCLTRDEIDDVESIIDLTSKLLEKAADISHKVAVKIDDPNIKAILEQVSSELVADSKIIKTETEDALENACEACVQAGQTLSSALETVENTLDSVFPDWKGYSDLKDLFDAFDQTLSEMKKFCPFEYEVFGLERLVSSVRYCLPEAVFDDVQKWHEVSATIEAFVGRNLQVSLRGPVSKAVSQGPVQGVCLTCADLVDTAEAMITELEAFLTRVFPAWESLPLLPQIDNFIHMILDNVHEMCPSFVRKLAPLAFVRKSSNTCLTKEEREELEHLVRIANTGFNSLEEAITELTAELPQSMLTDVLEGIENNIDSCKTQLDDFMEQIALGLCEHCQQVNLLVRNTVDEIGAGLDKLYPEWRENSVLSAIMSELQKVSTSFDGYCPTHSSTIHALQPYFAFTPSSPCILKMAPAGCLSEYEKSKLQNITKEIHMGLDFAAELVKLSAEFELNPVKRYSLEMGAKVIKAISKDIVTNFTKLADEFCGDCADLAKAMKDSILTLEETLFDVEPLWKKTPIYGAVLQLTEKVFAQIETFCPSTPLLVAEGCLTPSEQETLEEYTGYADKAFKYAAETIKVYAKDLAGGVFKDELLQVADLLEALDKDIIDNLRRIAREPCGTCIEVTKVLKDVETSVESAMNDVDPDWRSNAQYSEIALAVDSFIAIVETLCPSAVTDIATLARTNCKLTGYELEMATKLLEGKKVWLTFIMAVSDSSAALSLPDASMGVAVEAMEALFAARCVDHESFLKLYVKMSATGKAVSFPYGIQTTSCSGDDVTSAEVAFQLTEDLLGSFHSSLSQVQQSLSDKHQQQFIAVLKDLVELMKTSVEGAASEMAQSAPCISCGKMVEAISDALEEGKTLLIEILPGLKNSALFDALVTAVESLVHILHNFCPASTELFVVRDKTKAKLPGLRVQQQFMVETEMM